MYGRLPRYYVKRKCCPHGRLSVFTPSIRGHHIITLPFTSLYIADQEVTRGIGTRPTCGEASIVSTSVGRVGSICRTSTCSYDLVRDPTPFIMWYRAILWTESFFFPLPPIPWPAGFEPTTLTTQAGDLTGVAKCEKRNLPSTDIHWLYPLVLIPRGLHIIFILYIRCYGYICIYMCILPFFIYRRSVSARSFTVSTVSSPESTAYCMILQHTDAQSGRLPGRNLR